MIGWLCSKIVNLGSRHMAGSLDHVRRIRREEPNAVPHTRLGIIKAMNSRILEISTYDERSGDWVYEFFVVQEEQKISEAIAMVLLMKGLDK